MISHNLYPFTISTYLKLVWCQSAYSPRFNQNETDSTTKNFIGCFNWILWHYNLVLKLILGWNYHALRLFIHYWAFILNMVTTCSVSFGFIQNEWRIKLHCNKWYLLNCMVAKWLYGCEHTCLNSNCLIFHFQKPQTVGYNWSYL